jgi:opacity protein-like surface antigen
MKKMILALCLFILALGAVSAQEATDLKVIFNPADTTYRFCEVVTQDGDTVGIRFFPQTPVKGPEFVRYALGLAQQETERKQEFARLQAAVQKNINFLAAKVDEVGGSGTYEASQHSKLKAAMQGAWTLIIRTSTENDEEPEPLSVVINDSQFSTKDDSASITWTNGESFRLNTGVYNFNLTFRLAEPDRYVAERTSQGITTKYILKR